MSNAAEAFGEKAAEHHYIAEHYSDFDRQPLLGPKNGNDQFDQAWKHAMIESSSSKLKAVSGQNKEDAPCRAVGRFPQAEPYYLLPDGQYRRHATFANPAPGRHPEEKVAMDTRFNNFLRVYLDLEQGYETSGDRRPLC